MVSLAWLGFKPGCRRYAALALLVLLFGLLCLPRLGTAAAAATEVEAITEAPTCGADKKGIPADTLTIKVGYFGGPYYTKKVYTLGDIDALPQVEQAYTFMDNIPAVVIDSATGVKLTDLLADSGIDINSVQKFYFYATDVQVGWYQTLDKSFLLDEPRYYYPRLPVCWDYENQVLLPGAGDGAVRVEPVIAYKDSWQRYATAPDFSIYDTSTRFRLLLGQKEPAERSAPRSAKWVHAIEVMLGGMPPAGVTLDQDLVNLKVGSTVQLTATVAPDDATDQSVTWQSSDPGVAEVDENGLVTVTGSGEAAITVSTVVGNLTDACVVNGSEQSGIDREIPPVAAPSAVSPGPSSGPSGPEEKTPSNVPPAQPAGPPEPEEQKVYLAPRAEAAAVPAAASAGQSGRQPWRVFEMSLDTVPLQARERRNDLDYYAAGVLISLLFYGSGRKYREYARETD